VDIKFIGAPNSQTAGLQTDWRYWHYKGTCPQGGWNDTSNYYAYMNFMYYGYSWPYGNCDYQMNEPASMRSLYSYTAQYNHKVYAEVCVQTNGTNSCAP